MFFKSKFWPESLIIALVLLTCMWQVHDVIINHFYMHGAGTDSAWFASMSWRTSLWLDTPRILDERVATYFGSHISPIFWLPLMASYIFPVDYINNFGWFMAALYSLVVFATAMIIRDAVASTEYSRTTRLSLTGLFTGMYAISAVLVQQLVLPHFEMAISALVMLTIWLLLQSHTRAAVAAMLLGFCVREDFGLHLASFLLPVICIVWWQKRELLRHALYLSLAGVVLSVIITPIPTFFQYTQDLLRGTYIGDPPFAHITREALIRRFLHLYSFNNHLWVPLLLLVIAGLLRRSALLAVGGLIPIPWTLINVVFSRHDAAGMYTLYYPFPILVSLAWPMLYILMVKYWLKEDKRPVSFASMMVLQLYVLVASCIPQWEWIGRDNTQKYNYVDAELGEDAKLQPDYVIWRERVAKHADELGTLWANFQALAHTPYTLRRSSYYDTSIFDSMPVEKIPARDSFLVFEHPYTCQEIDRPVEYAKYPNMFYIKGTRLTLLTHKRFEDLLGFSDLLMIPKIREPRLCGLPKNLTPKRWDPVHVFSPLNQTSKQ